MVADEQSFALWQFGDPDFQAPKGTRPAKTDAGQGK
jgi:hypothetical protein